MYMYEVKRTVTDPINEKLSGGIMAVLGFQHVLAMYAGAVIVPLIIGGAMGLSQKELAFLVAADLFTCGIATLLQAAGIGKSIGIRLPVVLGSSFITMAPAIEIGKTYGITAVFGAVIASGIFVYFASFFIERLLFLFPKVVTGSFVTIIGLTLAPLALTDLAGGFGSPTYGSLQNILLGLFVLAIIVLLNKFLKGFMQAISVLIGIVAGTIVAGFMGMIDFTPVQTAGWVQIVTPFYFGAPKFNVTAILTICLFSLINMVESVGIFQVIAQSCDKKLARRDISNGLRAEGVAQGLAGIFNSFPHVTFSENAGLMVLTGVRSRFVIVVAGLMLMALGLFPKFSALATIVPHPVLGGAMIAIFGMIIVAGIQMLSSIDLTDNNNLMVIACSISVGIGVSVTPDLFSKMPGMVKLLLGNGLFSGILTAVVLNLVLNFDKIKEEIESYKDEAAVDLTN
jgi:xanthine permease